MEILKPDTMGQTWLLFEPLEDDVPDSVRFKRLLKHALRVLRLRCLRVSGRGPDEGEIGAGKGNQSKGH